MRFRADAKALRAATQQGLRTRSSRGTVETLGCFLLDAKNGKLTITSTDMQLTGRVVVSVETDKAGTVLVPATRFDKTISTFDGEVTVELEKNVGVDQVVVAQGTTRVTAHTMNVDDFPKVPQPAGKERAVVVLAPAYKRALDFVFPHAGSDESRPVLTGVLFEPTEDKLVLAATDSYRLAVTFADSSHTDKALGETPPIIPAKALAEVKRLLKSDLDYVEVRRHGDANQYVTFQVGNVTITSRLIDGQFPNWRQLRPEKMDHVTKVDRPAFVKACDRVNKLAGKYTTLRATFEKGKDLALKVLEHDVGEIHDTVPVIESTFKDKNPFEIGWNAAFFKECLQSFDTPDISIGTINALRPALLYNEPDGEFALVMPIRLAS